MLDLFTARKDIYTLRNFRELYCEKKKTIRYGTETVTYKAQGNSVMGIITVWGHTFMMSTRKGGGGDLRFVTCLQILLFLNIRSIVHFWGRWGWGVGSKNWSFFVDVISG